MRIIAIDPGNVRSALLVWSFGQIETIADQENHSLKPVLRSLARPGTELVLEMIGHYGTGMPAGREVFDTCVWIGRFAEAWYLETGCEARYILRPTVKTHLCGTPRAKDPNVRQALLDRFGGKAAIGRRDAPGPLYGVTGDLWSALAVAIVWEEQQRRAA
jgi:hypothetical protein